jgi:hypothetical protein
MKIIKDEKMIKRNARIGQIITVAAMVTLGFGMYVTLTSDPDKINYLIYVALIGGFVLSQIGIFFTNRWGRRPRPDELLDKALKGLDNRYSIYHFVLPSQHVLVGPSGVWVLLPKHQKGTITFSKNRWRQKTRGVLMAYLKLFAQEGLGRPDLEIGSEIEALNKFFKKEIPDLDLPEVNAALVFFHPEADVQVEDAPAPTLLSGKLKDFMRKTAKEKPVSLDSVKIIQESLGE